MRYKVNLIQVQDQVNFQALGFSIVEQSGLETLMDAPLENLRHDPAFENRPFQGMRRWYMDCQW